ncbi:MAG: murein biosynthesis integral membrane protein MurJ [Opitutales bacterium]|nr:murein biosynthesis integral membrane protein MurJ [Opitutales bacterium]
MNEQSRQYRNMAKTASWTMVSRILGLVRDQLIAAFFGAGIVASAFLFAFQIPNLFRRLLGEGALTAATVPVLAAKASEGGTKESYAFLNYIVRRMLPWMLGITLVGMGGALLWFLLAANDQQRYAAELTAWCMPYMPLICVAALFTSAVNLSGRFGLAEIASSALNLCMILGLGFFGYFLADTPMGQARWLCAGAVAGGVLQLLIPMWGLQQAGWKSRPVHADEKAWSALRIAFVPAALGAGILQINFLISRSLAFNVDGAGLTYYYIANRIVELPIGLFSTSIATVMFPAMATAFAQNDSDTLSRNYARGMRLILAINIAAAVGFVVFSREIVQVLFEFGKFKLEDCENTRLVLCLFALAMPFHAMISMVTRALNVIGNTTATFRVALQSVSVNVVASIFVVWKGYGIEGLACANAVAAMMQYVLLRMELKKSAPYVLAESLLKPCGQAIVGSLVMGGIAYQIFHFVNPLLHRWDVLNSKIALFTAMSIAAAIAAAVYAAILYWWKYPERDMLTDALNKVKHRLGMRTDA